MNDLTAPDNGHVRIAGYFPFFHRINYGLIRKAHLEGYCVDGYFHSVDPDGMPRNQMDHLNFLRAFDLNVNWHCSEGDHLRSSIDNPTEDVAQSLIRSDFLSMFGRSIFPDPVSLQQQLIRNSAHALHLVTTNGCFDVLHPGHIQTLEEARRRGDCLIVLINSDASVKRFKGSSRPIHDAGFRALILASLHAVDYVVIFDEPTPLHALECLQPGVHVKGGSFIEDRVRDERLLLSRWGGELVQIPMLGTYSTTSILERYSADSFPV